MLEAAMMLPILFLLLFGMVELARIGYTYFTIHKMLYSLARYVGTQQGVNFCDDADPILTAAKNLAVTGTADGSADPLVGGLTAEMISVRVERFYADTEELNECLCDITGCDASQGAVGPDFIVVSIPDGYPIRFSVPFMAQLDPIPLRPMVRLPFGGV
jgi:hypothetical protein